MLLQKLFIVQIGYLFAITFTKLSLLLLYLRLFSPSRRARYLILFGIILIPLFYTACLLKDIITCTPRPGENWAKAGQSMRCGIDINYVLAPFNVLSDFYLLAIPISVVWKLQLPLRKKVGAGAVFMTGFL
jgi:hypothetical protein